MQFQFIAKHANNFRNMILHKKNLRKQLLASTEMLGRTCLKYSKLAHHAIWKVKLHNIVANKRTDGAPILSIHGALRTKLHVLHLFAIVWLPFNLRQHIQFDYNNDMATLHDLR